MIITLIKHSILNNYEIKALHKELFDSCISNKLEIYFKTGRTFKKTNIYLYIIDILKMFNSGKYDYLDFNNCKYIANTRDFSGTYDIENVLLIKLLNSNDMFVSLSLIKYRYLVYIFDFISNIVKNMSSKFNHI